MPTRRANPVEYAEELLEVNKVWEETERLLEGFDVAIQGLRITRQQLHSAQFRLAELELDILGDERGKHIDLSVAAFDRHLKEAYHKHSAHKELRGEIAGHQRELIERETIKAQAEAHLRGNTARMTELGGYFNYLAAAKQAQSIQLAKQEKQSDS